MNDITVNMEFSQECQKAAAQIASGKGELAVFLGAGASKAFDWPLTNELLPIMLDGLIEGDLFEDNRINSSKINAQDRELLAKTLLGLCPGIRLDAKYLAENRKRLPLVTSLLSMVDYSIATGQSLITGFTPEQTRHARSLMERAIYEVIEHVETPAAKNYWPAREPNARARQLVDWLDGLRPNTSDVGVITSNYDLAIEKVWGFDQDSVNKIQKLGLDLGFSWVWADNNDKPTVMSRPITPQRRLYKLHGSTNWLRCGLCDRMYINPGVDIAIYPYDRKMGDNNKCHCGHGKLEVQIVSPSFIRQIQAPNLHGIWQRSLEWLCTAEYWIIIGYSFPDEDLNIRALFTRAWASRSKKPKVLAIQYGANEQTKMRYEAFFPANNLAYITSGLGIFLDNCSTS